MDEALDTWPAEEVVACIEFMPEEASLWMAIDPESHLWSTKAMLANLTAAVVDSFRTESIPRPWDRQQDATQETWDLVGDPMTMEEAAVYFGF